MSSHDNKILTVFFSHTGENYVSGKIVDLPVGNTAIAAKIITEYTDSDAFEIKTVKPYPYNYQECVAVSRDELKDNARPEIIGDTELEKYDIIILCYPNWCGTVPMPVFSFLDRHNLAGKIILPLCTNEGSRMGKSETDLQKSYPDAKVKVGLPILGHNASNEKATIENWLKIAI